MEEDGHENIWPEKEGVNQVSHEGFPTRKEAWTSLHSWLRCDRMRKTWVDSRAYRGAEDGEHIDYQLYDRVYYAAMRNEQAFTGVR